MKIYEKVVLPKDQFTQYGDPIFYGVWDTLNGRYQFVSRNGAYRYFTENEQLKFKKPSLEILTWNPANLSKATLTVIRKADNKTLGTYIYYLRTGGAIMPRLGPDPAKLCPENASEAIFLRTLFVQEN